MPNPRHKLAVAIASRWACKLMIAIHAAATIATLPRRILSCEIVWRPDDQNHLLMRRPNQKNAGMPTMPATPAPLRFAYVASHAPADASSPVLSIVIRISPSGTVLKM
jgi:hypothetical protein